MQRGIIDALYSSLMRDAMTLDGETDAERIVYICDSIIATAQTVRKLAKVELKMQHLEESA